MKKLHLINIIKEVLLEEKGYSRYVDGGTTPGLTKNTLDKILLRIAKGEDLPGDSEERGNKILDKADPENVARIIRGELPQYNEEVDRMQELAGIQSEIRVNSPGKIQFDYDEDDDDGELKVVSLSKDGETWWGTEPYVDEPGFIKMEFLFEEEEDREVEQEQMDKLTSLLDKHNIPYEITGDDELKFIKIPKDKLDLR